MASPVGETPLASRKRKQLKRDFDKDINLLKKYGRMLRDL